MRKTFIKTLVDLATKDTRILFLTGDLGYTVVEPFSEKFPDRFINVGVAEQNMVGLATGLAEAGYIPFLYSIVPFAVLRPYEFIRNGPIFHQLPVRIIGVGSGLEYQNAGFTHHGLEDIGVLRLQPGIKIIIPADYQQARTSLHNTWDLAGPIYYRLGKDDENRVTGFDGHFEIGHLDLIRSGKDALLVTAGNITREVAIIVDELHQQGVSCTLAVVSSFNPSPEKDLITLLGNFSSVITIEAHYKTGAVGSFVAEVIAENKLPCQLVRIGIEGIHAGEADNNNHLNYKGHLSCDSINKVIRGQV